MATEDAATGGNYPTQEEYQEKTYEERDVPLPESGYDFRVREIAPLYLMKRLEQFGLMDLIDAKEADDEDPDIDWGDVLRDQKFSGFFETVVVPNVVKPNVYYQDESDGNFDLTVLHKDDIGALITGLAGVDELPDDDSEEELGDKFPE